MGSLGEFEPSDRRAVCREDPGLNLTSALASYVHHLERELAQLPPPRMPSCNNVAEKSTIVALCNKVIAMTMDPEMYLFTTSLQVRQLITMPLDRLTNLSPHQFHFCSCLKTAVDLRVHEHVPQHGTVSGQQLAKAVGADEKLLSECRTLISWEFRA
jgi:hypothetical protein